MNGRTPGRSRGCAWAAALLLAAAPVARAAEMGAIVQEVARATRQGSRIIDFWWLPVEYWVEAARVMKKPAGEVDEVRRLFRSYLILGALDATIGQDGTLSAAPYPEMAPGIHVRRNDVEVKVLREVDPRVARLTAELGYFLRTSLTTLGPGLRFFFLSNVDDQGRPILQGISTGVLQVHYARAEPAGGGQSFRWHTPLTSIAGPVTCPRGGEELEASWVYCPWHGVRVR